MTRRNIGVAIGVPEPFGGQLQRWRDRFGDPNAAAIVPHVTLLPPTMLDTEALPEVDEHLRKVAAAAPAFTMQLRGTATFRPASPVVFVPLAAGISECETLACAVRSGPLARALRFPYHPHVTVAHDLPEAALDRAFRALAGYSARFTVWGFSLFEQGADRVWRPQRDYAFAVGGAAGPGGTPPREEPGW